MGIGSVQVSAERPPGPLGARRRPRFLTVAVVVIAEVLLAVLAVRRPELAVGAALAGLAVLAAVHLPRPVLAVGLLSPFLTTRIGGSSADLSLTDAYTLVGLVAAAPFLSFRSNPDLRRLFLGFGAYLVVLTAAVLINPSQVAFVELGHRALVYGSAILVGAAIVASGQLQRALRLFVFACAGVSLLAVVESARSGYAPAYPLDLQKNAAGLLFAAGILVLLSGRRWLQLPRPTYLPLMVACAGGLLAAQSRSAFLALVVVVAVRVVLDQRRRVIGTGTKVVIALLCLALAGTAWSSIRERDLEAENRQFGAVDTRVEAFDYAVDRWREEPVFGVGLRYWTDPAEREASGVAFVPVPHSLVVGELGESGVVGLVALAGLLGWTALVLQRRRDLLSHLGLDVFALRVVQGVVEIFWVAGPLTLGTLFVGIGLGDDPEGPEDRRRRADEDPNGETALTS
jgi:hypothetical protein